MAIKRILRYLKGIEDYGLWYKIRGNIDLKVFTDDNLGLSKPFLRLVKDLTLKITHFQEILT